MSEQQKPKQDPWIRRLGIVLRAFEKMEPREREATLEYINSKYGKRT